MRSGQDLAEYTCCWIEGHWPTFRSIMAIAHRAVDNGEYLSGNEVYYRAKQAGVSISDLAEYKRDKSLWSGIARYMVMLRPRLAKCLEFRKSKLDDVDLVKVWHENVRSDTTFLASSWKEAVRLCEINDAAAM